MVNCFNDNDYLSKYYKYCNCLVFKTIDGKQSIIYSEAHKGNGRVRGGDDG